MGGAYSAAVEETQNDQVQEQEPPGWWGWGGGVST